MKIITESEMDFGKFNEADLFHIENSRIYKNLGSGIKTVEFILKYNTNSILFLEAKKSCPNANNRYDSKEKARKFEEYYSSITEKFISSLQIYLASILDRYQNRTEIGDNLNVENMKNIRLKFVLVIKNADDIMWLAGPRAELKNRLIQMRKIWNIDIIVLNEQLAKDHHLIRENEP